MDIEQLRTYCLEKNGTSESFPFDENTLVFKVMNKMYLLIGLNDAEPSFNVKCDPEKAIQLREEFPDYVQPGYHMNKKYWNTVSLNAELSDDFIQEQIDHSYALVVDGLTKKQRAELQQNL